MFNKTFRKVSAAVLAMTMVFSLPVMADEGDGGEIIGGDERLVFDNFEKTYDINASLFTVDGTGLITAVDESLKEAETIVIPTNVVIDGENVKVTGIADEVFEEFFTLNEVIIPNDIVTFGENVFAGDVNLKIMEPYESCQLNDDGTKVGFDYKVDENGYDYIKLDEFFIPDGAQVIAGSTFFGCTSIYDFVVSSDNKSFTAVNSYGSWEAISNKTVDNTKTTYDTTLERLAQIDIDNAADGNDEYFRELFNGELLITRDGKILIDLADGYRGDCYVIPEGIETIAACACGIYSLEGVYINNGYLIPKTVKEIGDFSFVGNSNQGNFSFEEGSVLETVGMGAFMLTNNLNITLPNTVKTIGEYCFYGANNAVIDISNTQIEVIPAYSFAYQPTLHELTAPATLKSIAEYAFAGSTNLDTVNFLGETLESIGTGAFEGCRTLHTITIPEGVKTIEADTFSGCGNLGTVILPESLETIAENAFKDCVTIHEMVIPEGVTYIDKTAFDGANLDGIDTSKNAVASKLLGRTTEETDDQKAAKLKGKTVSVGGYKYKIVTSTAKGGTATLVGSTKKNLKKVNVKATFKYTYQGKTFTYKVTAIKAGAFKKYKKLKKVVIGKNVKKIGKKAFFGCKKLKNVVIKSKGLKKIGKKAFYRKGGKKVTFKVPKSKKKKYKKLLKKAKTNKFKVK